MRVQNLDTRNKVGYVVDTPPVAKRRGSAQTFKRRVRAAVDAACQGSGLLRWAERGMRRGLTILMYHRVLPRAQCLAYPLESLVIPEDVFDRQVAWLASRYTVLPVGEALRRLEDGERPDLPLVAISFDDGYADNHAHAAPVLARHGVRGTFFVTTGFVESGEPTWFDRAADAWIRLETARQFELASRLDAGLGKPGLSTWMAGLKRLGVAQRERLVAEAEASATGAMDRGRYAPMNVSQLAELHRDGHEVASHSVSHPILTTLGDDQLAAELRDSRARLQEWIGVPVTGLCYPNGDCDDRVVAAARQVGYRYGCATTPGLNLPAQDAFQLHRRSITMHRTLNGSGGHDVTGFRSEISGLRDWWR